MLRYLLLASTVAIASPALAQEAPKTPATAVEQQTMTNPTPPVQDTKAPEQIQQATTAVPPQDAQAQAQAQATPADPAAQPVQTAATPPAQPAPTQQATTPDQVAQAVGAGWATYDKDANGTLDKTEFAAWMVALRQAAQPAFDPQSPTAVTWVGQAFAQADVDKSATVNQGELTTFLTPKAG